ncbi:MAG: hypothetical protein JWM80_4327 [Cyanobacteria bacterium RYN_339]|nr:hypothetical protein [Cyanobacteria bacterium RYN_339]
MLVLPFVMLAEMLVPGPPAIVAAAVPRSVDGLFGFQQYWLESPPPPELAPEGEMPDVYHVYAEDVRLGERRVRIYLTYFKGLLASIELQPVEHGELADLRADLVGMYGKPTRSGTLKTVWEGKLARMTWVQIFGATIVTLNSVKLEGDMKKAGAI